MRHKLGILATITLSLAVTWSATDAGEFREKLKANQPVKIVCLGDSVTGVYYHTGGRRAYTAMVGVALDGAFPKARVTAINAGISGNTTADGLKRLQKDVLAHKPDLVTVMFGLNDMVRVPIPDFKVNLGQIIQRCRGVGAEVLLCTPNSVIDTSNRRIATLVDYCDAIHEVARKHQVPVCDVHATYEALRSRDPVAWRLLLSDEIHPNMDGHKLIAETICLAITGEDVSLETAGPPLPAVPRTLALVKAGKPVRVLAMSPYDEMIGPALRAVVPTAQVEVKRWPTAGKTLAQIEAAAKEVRKSPPDLVLIALPMAITPDAQSPPEAVVRSHAWIFNWSLAFGRQQWDVVGIAPSVLKTGLTAEEKARDEFSRQMILAQDLHVIARPENDQALPEKILENWLRAQLSGK
jgi:lysophospholipase L1-like esterase